jgi:protoporphyrinogen oxidase
VEALELMDRLTRREFLTALLGAAAAASACKRAPVRPAFSGRLLGQAIDRGHRLRDAQLPAPRTRTKVKVLIAGGGAAGLSAAWALARAGVREVALLELEDRVGGTSAHGENAVSAFPWGAHYVPVPGAKNRALVALLDELGALESVDAVGAPIVREELLCRAPQERLYIAGQWQDGLFPRVGATAEDLRQLAAFESEVARWVGFRDAQGRRAFTVPSAGCGDAPELDALDRVSMGEFLDARGLTSPRLRWYVEYGCRDDYGATLATTSAWAGLFYFAARVDKPGGHGAEFVTFPEGNGRLIEHLRGKVAPFVRTAVAVTRLAPTERGVEVDAFDFAAGQPLGFEAEHVICALPRHVAAKVVAPWRDQRPPFAEATYSSWVVANLTLSSRLEEPGAPLAWDNVLYDSRGLGYVVATHQQGRDFGPTVLTYYLPLLDQTPSLERQLLSESDWSHWVDAILADLSRAHPDLAERLTSLDVWRWGHAMVRPAPGTMRGPHLTQARAPLGRIRFAHTDLSGMALFEEAQHWGITAAEDVLAALAVPFRSLVG